MSKKSLKERLEKKRQEIQERASSGTGNLIFIKPGTYRVRVLPVGEDEEFAYEITHMYLGPEIKGVISPSSVGDDCPMVDKYQELKAEGDSSNTAVLKALKGKSRFLLPVMVYKDERGKEVDEENSGKLMIITPGLYGQMIDFFLDPDLGDFTDPDEGYDLKIKRTGSGMTDTEYSVSAMRPSKIPAKWDKPTDLTGLVRSAILPFEEVEDKLAEYLVTAMDEEPEEETTREPREPRKRKRRRPTD